jgi:hypothetical protein
MEQARLLFTAVHVAATPDTKAGGAKSRVQMAKSMSAKDFVAEAQS